MRYSLSSASALGPDQRDLRPDEPVKTLAEFLSFIEEFEAIAVRSDEPRAPIQRSAFRL